MVDFSATGILGHRGLEVLSFDGVKGRRAPQIRGNRVLMTTSVGIKVRTLLRSPLLLADAPVTPHQNPQHFSAKLEDLNCGSLIGRKKPSMGKIDRNFNIPSDAKDSVLASPSNPIAAGVRTRLGHLAAEDADLFPLLLAPAPAKDLDSSEDLGR